MLPGSDITKYIISGSTLSQSFFADIGHMENKALHSFVSRNPIRNNDFKSSLIRVLYVLGQSRHSEDLMKNIIDAFPNTCFVKSPSKLLRVPTATRDNAPETNELREVLHNKEIECRIMEDQLKAKTDELNGAKREITRNETVTEALRKELQTKEIELKATKDKLNGEITDLKMEIAEKTGALTALNESIRHHRQMQLLHKNNESKNKAKPPFNRFA